MKSCGVGFWAPRTGNARVAFNAPLSRLNSNTAAADPPPTYTRSPLDEMARPSQASVTGTLLVTAPEAVFITLMLGGRYPPLSTSRCLPSGVSADAMGKVESATCFPAGSRRQPLFNRNPPVGSAPTCSRGAGCELSSAAKAMHAMASRGLSADFIQVPPLYSRGAEDLVVRATRRAHLV